MDSKAFGALAACIAGLAVVLCGLSVAIELSMPVRIAMLAVALVLLASAGGLIGAAISAGKKSSS